KNFQLHKRNNYLQNYCSVKFYRAKILQSLCSFRMTGGGSRTALCKERRKAANIYMVEWAIRLFYGLARFGRGSHLRAVGNKLPSTANRHVNYSLYAFAYKL
ncbi:MAG: hypothetical protein IJ362_08435, partial [Oscillospiraceae bacterium]|nr:hypothetical protein [Oscillospiraceae bacterium]